MSELGVTSSLFRPIRQVVRTSPTTAHYLNAAGARPADLLVTPQSVSYRTSVRTAQTTGEHDGILDGLRSALRKEWEHGVSGVTEQADTAHSPPFKWISVVKSPTLGFTG